MIPPRGVYDALRARGLGPRILGALEAHRHHATPKALTRAAVNLAKHHLYCRRFSACDPDWIEAIALGLPRPLCRWCRHAIPDRLSSPPETPPPTG